MAVKEDMVMGTPTLYKPTPPAVLPNSPVTTVPGATPGPVTGEPTAMGVPPTLGYTEDTVMVEPLMVAVYVVGTAGVAAVITTGPPVVVVVVVVVVEVGMNTVYTPAPPPPPPPPLAVVEGGRPVMYVPGGTPGPVMALPTPNAPLPTAVTVRVVPDRDATTPVAASVAAAAGEEDTVCVVGAATEYVPRPVVGDTLSTPVTTVPGTTPGPDTGVPTASRVGVLEVEEEVKEVTVITLPEMDATKVGGGAAAAAIAAAVGGAVAMSEVMGRVCGMDTV